MKLRKKDVLALLIGAAIAVPYVGYLLNGSMPFVRDPRGMAAIGLVLGAAAFAVIRRGDPVDRLGKAEIALAVVVLALGVAALALAETAAAGVWLAVFMGAILVMLVVELADHVGVVPGHEVRGQRQLA
ncbi:hypothetical protein [Georgenia sp. H159]|uniref:hypothetical protein n=1 Tax=Georgenia sp. H159 TaxID=3076115 RepID=UPI002D777254|nr:hypothetical protein [Georgenia sp. H159]